MTGTKAKTYVVAIDTNGWKTPYYAVVIERSALRKVLQIASKIQFPDRQDAVVDRILFQPRLSDPVNMVYLGILDNYGEDEIRAALYSSLPRPLADAVVDELGDDIEDEVSLSGLLVEAEVESEMEFRVGQRCEASECTFSVTPRGSVCVVVSDWEPEEAAVTYIYLGSVDEV